jgi:copper chaperone
MKTSLKLSAAAAVLAFSTGLPIALACEGKEHDAKQEKKQPAPARKVASATFTVEGMHCEGCSDKVKATLTAKAGILKVDVKAKQVTVEYDAEKWTVDKIAKVIGELGYKATAEA